MCSIAQQTKDAVRVSRAIWGHSLPPYFSTVVGPLHYLDRNSFPLSPPSWAWGTSSGNQEKLTLFFIFLPAPVICDFHIWFCLMPNIYSWKGEGKLIIHRTFPGKISVVQEKWFILTIRNAFLCGNYKIHWEPNQKIKHFFWSMLFLLLPFYNNKLWK